MMASHDVWSIYVTTDNTNQSSIEISAQWTNQYDYEAYIGFIRISTSHVV